ACRARAPFRALSASFDDAQVRRISGGADDRIRTGDLLITNPIQPRFASLRPATPLDVSLLYQLERAEEIRCFRSHLAYAPL
ncbi:MAG: hypothetical protein OZ948_15460, partial [Deltaproteobacteria bacterium]|nr:hypothetical protein [Deltaproteobacteria bacterium]